jgi:ethanolamine utilization protein EutP
MKDQKKKSAPVTQSAQIAEPTAPLEEAGLNKRVILIGRTTAGKTTLCQYICREELQYSKTQAVQIFKDSLIDTPGEYLEIRHYRGALHVTSTEADVIVLVQDPTEDGSMFPPAYAASFGKPAVGVITKQDLATPEQIERARGYLRAAGAEEIFTTSSVDGTGFDALYDFLSAR